MRKTSLLRRLARFIYYEAFQITEHEKHLRAKRENLNSNIRKFILEHSNIQLPPRESELKPEILIPCYNHGHYLEHALASVHEASVPVTVVDDASTDDTKSHIERLARKYKFKLIENEENLMQWGSLNKAVSLSLNNLFIVLNADDALLPFSIDLILDIFTQYHNVRMVGGSSIWITDSDTIRFARYLPERLDYQPKVRIHNPKDAVNFRKISDINMSMSSCSFLRSAWQAVGGFRKFEERICPPDDRDFQMRVAALFPVATVDEPLTFWRTTSSTQRGKI